MSFDRIAGRLVLGAVLALPTFASAQAAATVRSGASRELPIKYSGKPTTPPRANVKAPRGPCTRC